MIAAACGMAAFAVACTHATDTAGAPSFGQALRTNREAQTNPTTVDPAAPEGSGAQGALGQQRYRTGQTRPLMPASSSTTNSSSSD